MYRHYPRASDQLLDHALVWCSWSPIRNRRHDWQLSRASNSLARTISIHFRDTEFISTHLDNRILRKHQYEKPRPAKKTPYSRKSFERKHSLSKMFILIGIAFIAKNARMNVVLKSWRFIASEHDYDVNKLKEKKKEKESRRHWETLLDPLKGDRRVPTGLRCESGH